MSTGTGFDAIIIGAGPAGTTAAIMLARAGWRVAIVEKHEYPRRKVCGECIAASNLPLLESLGIGPAFFAQAGPPLKQVALMSAAHIIRADLPLHPSSAHRWGVALGREHLDGLLLAQAARCGAQVFQPWSARGVEGGPGRFACRIRAAQGDGDLTLTAPVLIAAHGSWEPLQEGAPQPPRRPQDLLGFKANFSDANLENGLLPVLAFPGGYGGMVVAGGGVATFAFCMRRDVLEEAKRRSPGLRPAQAAADYVAAHCTGVRDMLSGATLCGPWLGAGPLRPGIRMPRHGGEIFLVGNAAGEAHPIIGEGISMALQSAWLLAHRLASARTQVSDPEIQRRLQQEYARDWHRHFAPRIRLAATFAHAAMRPRLHGALLPVLARHPALLGRFARWSGKIRPVGQPPAGGLAEAGYP